MFYNETFTEISGWSEPTLSSKHNSNNENYLFINTTLKILIRQKLRRRRKRKDFLYHYLYFCSTIAYLYHIDKRFNDSEYVPIHYKTMSSIISQRHYKKIITDLKVWGIIEENQSYHAGYNSKSYKLLPPYNQNLKRTKIKDKLINDKLNNRKKETQKEIDNLPLPYQYLRVSNTMIEMDYESAHTYNRDHFIFKSTPSVYESNFYSISAYEDKDYIFKVDKFGNRAHSNLTNLKTELRSFLTVDGEPLGQIDIKNSQPLFFYLHIKNNSEIENQEKEKYKRLVESGRFYEFIMEKLDIPFRKRKKVKHKILSAIFFDRHRKNESRYMRVFRKEFPSIAQYITKTRKRDHKKLAQILQKSESKFVIGTVVPAFIKQYGQNLEFISTIHDSIVVKSKMLPEAKLIMTECFNQEGINAILSQSEFR